LLKNGCILCPIRSLLILSHKDREVAALIHMLTTLKVFHTSAAKISSLRLCIILPSSASSTLDSFVFFLLQYHRIQHIKPS
jgi:hypothetical protein